MAAHVAHCLIVKVYCLKRQNLMLPICIHPIQITSIKCQSSLLICTCICVHYIYQNRITSFLLW